MVGSAPDFLGVLKRRRQDAHNAHNAHFVYKLYPVTSSLRDFSKKFFTKLVFEGKTMWWEMYASMIVLMVVGIKTVYSVKCYSCLGTHNYEYNNDCTKPDVSQLSLVKCNMEALQQTREYAKHIDPAYQKLFDVDSIEAEPGRIGMSCLKMITTVGNKQYFLRGCQLAEQGYLDICNKVKEEDNAVVKTVHCVKCSSEACNFSSKLTTNMVLTIIAGLTTKIIYSIV